MRKRILQALALFALLTLAGCGTPSAASYSPNPSSSSASATATRLPTATPGLTGLASPIGPRAPLGPVLYAGLNSGTFVTLNPNDGTRYWYNTIGGNAAPVLDAADSLLYVTAPDNTLYALDAHNGALRWRYQVGAAFSEAAASGDVFLSTSAGSLVALKADDGSVLWQKQISAGHPAVFNGVVYIGANDGVHALNAQDGSESWHKQIAGGVAAEVLADGAVYALGMDGNLYCLNTGDGSQRWQVVYGAVATAVPLLAAADGMVYLDTETGTAAAGASGNIQAFNAGNGEQRWKLTNSAFGPLTASGGMLYVSAGAKLLALQSGDGTQRWSFSNAVSSKALLANGVLYVGSSDGTVYRLNPYDGSGGWHSSVGGPVGLLAFSQ